MPDAAEQQPGRASDPLQEKLARRTRELQVLRLITAGKTNRTIAIALSLSERTIDRHVSNILTKLGVPSRAAAAAHACRYQLV